MPAAPRKSVGNARNKKHIPYRHDDLQHGKRTGMAVDVVDRNSDDFEPFDKILSQADTRTPPRVKGNKRKSTVPSPVYEDEDGEMSMELASPLSYFGGQRARVPESLISAGLSARTSYLSPELDFDQVPSPRASVAAISASRRRSSMKVNGKSPGSGLGRSRLSQSHLNATPKTGTGRKSRVEEDESPGLPGDSDGYFEDGFEPPPTFELDSRNAPRSPSSERSDFQDISREEDEPPTAPEPDLVTPTSNSRHNARDRRKSKGDSKPLFLPDSDDEQPEASTSKQSNRRKSSKISVAPVEFEQYQEEEEVEENPPEDVEMDFDPPVEEDFDSRRSKKLSSIMEAPEPEEEDEPEPMDFEQDDRPDEPPEDQPDEPPEEPGEPPSINPPKKRGRKKISFDENSANLQRPPKKPRSNRTPLADKTEDSRYISIRPVTESPENPRGLRRSRRYRYKPLDWWRLEKVVYGADYDEDQGNDSEDSPDKPITLVPPIKAILRVPQEPVEPLGKKHKKRRGKSVTVDPESVPFPEAGWDKDTEAFGHVIDFATKDEVRRRIAFTARMFRETRAAKADYSYQKIFSEGERVAAGYIHLDPGAEKPNKSSKDNSYLFNVVQGAIHVKIHTTSFMICQGGCFLVPSGNYYYIKNVCDRTVKIFFVQYRDLPEGEEGEEVGERVSGRERASRRTEVERPTPPLVQRGKTKSQKVSRGNEAALQKTGPPRGRKKK